MSNTYNVGWLRDNENQIFIPFTYTKSVKLDDKGNTLDSTVTLVDEHTDAIAGINETLEKIQNGNIHAGIADSTKGTLSIGNKHFNGSENLTVKAKDLGITGALVYRGISTTPITDKGTEAPFIDNATVAITDLEPGNIVLYNVNGEIYQEYLWTGDHWELLGDEGSYAYRSITVEAGAGLTGGGTLAQDFGLSVVPDNHTVVIDDNNRVAMKQLTSAGTYGQEADIPDLEPQATREFKVPYFTVDNYGRITSAQTKTIQIVNDSEVMDAIARIEADIAGDSGEVDNIVPRLAQVETRTKYIDASSDEGVFQIVDGEGKIGVQVDDQGVKSFDFILSNGNVSLVQKLKALDEKDTALTDGISDIEARTVTAGAGLTGGGSLADSMTINIGKGAGIQINENSIQLEAVENLSTGSFGESENYTKGFNNSFTIPHITVDEYGRITAVKSVTINMPQDGAILDNISKVEEDLTKLINDTKTELQGNIDNVNTTLDSKIDNVNTTLNTKIDNVKSALDKKDEELSDTLGKEVTALNNTITEQVNALSERINTNKTNIESNDIDIGNLDQRVSANEKEIEDIHELNDEQNDNISNLETRAANLEIRTQFMDASSPDAFQITDEEGYVGFSVDTVGVTKTVYDFYIPEGDISLRGLDNALDAEIKTRTEEVKALQDKDIELNDALTNLIDETKKDLQDEIDSDVDTLASELRQKDSDLDTKIDNLATELRAKDDSFTEKDEELSDAINAISDNKIIAGDGLILDNTGTLSEESITISAQVDRGLDISSDKIGHTNSITAGSVSGTDGSVNTSITIPKITYDAQGHITKAETTTADLSGITDAINKLDEDLNNRIDTLNDKADSINNTLDAKIDKTKTDLQAEIDSDVAILAEELRAKDQELNDNLTANIEAINTALKDTILDPLQAKISANEDNITANKNSIDNLSNRVTDCENEIGNIHITNGEQNDQLADHDGRLIAVETRTQFMDASAPDEFHITDEQGYPGFTFGSDGIAKAQDFVTSSTTDEDNNISLKETKKALDAEVKNREEKDTEFTDAINDINDKLKIEEVVGSTVQPVYFDHGTPTACVENFTFYQEIGADDVDPSTSSTFCVLKTGDTMSGPLISTGFIGPLTGNATSADKLNTDAGSSTLPIYFLGGIPTACDDSILLPTGGSEGHVLIKNSSTDGDASWKELVALPKGGTAGQVLVKNDATDGNASWLTHTLTLTGDVTGSGSFDSAGNLSITTAVADNSHNHSFLARRAINTITTTADDTTANWGAYSTSVHWYNTTDQITDQPNQYGYILNIGYGSETQQLWFSAPGGGPYYRGGNGSGWSTSWKKLWLAGDSVTGAVWNDYAECRESDCEEFGYVLMENGDDTLSKTTERLSHFAGVSSDTWGFSQGETARARTPIAVAGRVLVYPYQNRNNYKPGDCVCAAPGGTVDIMTREEIINWPDRIVGTVSCVPDYEEWGGGQGADRPSVKVNGRIWIKVK